MEVTLLIVEKSWNCVFEFLREPCFTVCVSPLLLAGNLYSHMRKHTGQYYRCDKCKFKTVNKSHLLEHEMTHSGIRHVCEMCKKDYNTQKSLMNHVRKYHTSKKGDA